MPSKVVLPAVVVLPAGTAYRAQTPHRENRRHGDGSNRRHRAGVGRIWAVRNDGRFVHRADLPVVQQRPLGQQHGRYFR